MQTNTKKPKGFRVRVGNSQRELINTLFSCNINHQADHYTKIANGFIANNGPKWTCSRLKSYYEIGCKISLNLNFDNILFCKTKGKYNVPRDMVPFLQYLTSPNLNYRRACLTLLRSFTQIYSQALLDTESITAPGSDKSHFTYYRVNFDKICEKYKRFTKPFLVDESLFTTSKNGPNGHALLHCDKDFHSIKNSDEDILSTIKELNFEIGIIARSSLKREVNLSQGYAPDFDAPPDEDMVSYKPRSERKLLMYEAMDNFNQWRINKEPNCYANVIHSKISLIAEGGCKTRTIAIGDLFTQDCLKPIHKSLYRVLSKLETDGTYSHNRISSIVKERTSKGSLVRSFDLTNATDRFPIFMQERVLSCLYGPKISTLWKKLMVNRKFRTPDAKYVEYSTGQPMGLLSSWAAFALTHHVIIETCALQVGINSFKDYVVIGDDVTIFNKIVADEYVRFLKTFNIDISKSKSLESEGNPSSAEIAKRIFMNGNELSPIPYDAIESAIKNYLLFPNLAKLCLERDVYLNISDQKPVQSTLKSVYGNTNAQRVLTLLSFPLSTPLVQGKVDIWKDSDVEIRAAFNEVRKDFIKSKAKDLYQNELSNIPDMGILGAALESDCGPEGLNLHPLFALLRAYRDRCGSIFQGITMKGLDDQDLSLIPFLVNPMIPNYIRRSHQIEKVRSTLILKVYQKLEDKAKEIIAVKKAPKQPKPSWLP